MKTNKIVLGLIAGAAFGAIAGILAAPDKGSVTREHISKRSTSFADVLMTLFSDFVRSWSARIDSTTHEPVSIPGNGQSEQDVLSLDISDDKKVKS